MNPALERLLRELGKDKRVKAGRKALEAAREISAQKEEALELASRKLGDLRAALSAARETGDVDFNFEAAFEQIRTAEHEAETAEALADTSRAQCAAAEKNLQRVSAEAVQRLWHKAQAEHDAVVASIAETLEGLDGLMAEADDAWLYWKECRLRAKVHARQLETRVRHPARPAGRWYDPERALNGLREAVAFARRRTAVEDDAA